MPERPVIPSCPNVRSFPHDDWRERTRPTAAQLVDLFIAVVRVVAGLHRRGILIRDFKSAHGLVPEDQKPGLVDMGSARLPGGSTLTVGLAPGTPHTFPPESIAFLREGSWKKGARFTATPAGDLYQVGVFMFEALTDCWPFDARMPADELLTAIQTVVPRAPHRLNPAVPESLSRIAMRLLEKRPEDRFASAEALLQALWEANKERSTKEWKVSLALPPGGPTPRTQDEEEERRFHQQQAERRGQEARQQQQERSAVQTLEQFSAAIQQMEAEVRTLEEKAALRRKRWRRIGLGVGLVLLSLGLLTAGWEWLAPASSEKGSSLVSTLRNSWPVRTVAAWLCTTFSVGCAAPQLRPIPEDCPPDTVQRMKELNLFKRDMIGSNALPVVIDIHQPGMDGQLGVYHAGRIVSRVELPEGWKHDYPVPDGTLLYGQLWTEGLSIEGREAVYGRYTEMLLPDGRRFPVCYTLGSTGYKVKRPGSKPGEPVLERDSLVIPVERWP
ncbi:protein kinase domain-containing protein [Hyalangium gracile]|uniref:protein kinase domain-containing protein n=1 Tax=Hyalangium gracile TaxID=394092 RepID=UPI001CCC4FE7|nr:serine/threonine protein kinase [Hyalangium gracile]